MPYRAPLRVIISAVTLTLALGMGTSYPSSPGGMSWPPDQGEARIVFERMLPDPNQPKEQAKEDWFSQGLSWLLGTHSGKIPASQRLMRPTGLWARWDRLYVADPGSGRVQILSLADGKTLKTIPAPPAPRLLSPVGVAVDVTGKIFVTDSELGKVLVYSEADGNTLAPIQAPPHGWLRPTGMALDQARARLWVSDTARHTVHAFELSGRYLFSLGKHGNGKGEFNFPTYLWADPRSGEVWVCDNGNFRIQWFDKDGHFLGKFGEAGNRPGFLPRPRGVVLDSEGHVYNADGALETVQIFDTQGKLLLFFGESGQGVGYFSMPGGLFMDREDHLYVADTLNSRIQIFRYNKEHKP